MYRVFLILLVLSTLSIACKTIVLHPVSDEDIKMQGNWVCMSPEYVKTVMKVKLEAK
jgi:hypothetical protein